MADRNPTADHWFEKKPDPPSIWGAVILLAGLVAVFGLSTLIFRNMFGRDRGVDPHPTVNVTPENGPSVRFASETPQGKRWIEMSSNDQKLGFSISDLDGNPTGGKFNFTWSFYRDGKEIEDNLDSAVLVSYGGDVWKHREKKAYVPKVEATVSFTSNSASEMGRPGEFLVFECLDEANHKVAKAEIAVFRGIPPLEPILVLRSPEKLERLSPDANGAIHLPYLPIAGSKIRFSLELRNLIDEQRHARMRLIEKRDNGNKLLTSSASMTLGQETKKMAFQTGNQTDSKESVESTGRTLLVNPNRILVEVEELDPSSFELTRKWEFPLLFENANWEQWIERSYTLDLRANTAFAPTLQVKSEFWKLLDSDITTIPQIIRWKDERKSAISSGRYETQLHRPGVNPSLEKSPVQGAPVLNSEDNQLRFEFDLGGYVSAATYELTVEFPGSGATSSNHSWKPLESPRTEPAVLEWWLTMISNDTLELVWNLPQLSETP